ncbi:hypothetical protein Tco_0240761 [Tanacetum coccineum]
MSIFSFFGIYLKASLAGSVPASNKGDAPAKPPQIITTNTLSNIKLPVLQKDDYDTWAMEMEHYLEYIDNEVWKQNRLLMKKKEARTLLLMAVPKDHLRRFHGMDDAKEIWAAIKTRDEKFEKGFMIGFKNSLSRWMPLVPSVQMKMQITKFLMVRPPAWDSLAMTLRTKKNLISTVIDDVYNNMSQINWVEQTTDEEINHALMAFTVNNEVSMCSKLCLDSYNALKAKYDELQSEFGDQEAALTAHKIGLKKVEAQLKASHKQLLKP